jgi:hypothetical protein
LWRGHFIEKTSSTPASTWNSLVTDVAGAVLDNSAVGGSLRVWQFAILNLNDSESVNYFTGIVCAKGL